MLAAAGSRSARKWTASTKSRPVASITKSIALKFSSQRKHRPRLVRGLTAVSDSPQRGSEKLFDPAAKSLIHDYSGGVPLQINNLATACLLAAAAQNASRISEAIRRPQAPVE